MRDLQRIFEAARSRAGVLATVVRVEGSAYRRPGARMFLPDGGEPIGLVSGGCLEADLAERARELGGAAEPQVVVYDTRSPNDVVWGLGLGCNGEIRVLLERTGPGTGAQDYLAFVADLLDRRRPGVLATLCSAPEGSTTRPGARFGLDAEGADRVSTGSGALDRALRVRALRCLGDRRSHVAQLRLPAGECEALIEYLAPRPRLLVFGAGADAVPVVRLAAQLGWIVELADHRRAYATPRRFPEVDRIHLIDGSAPESAALAIDANTFAVVMTHHFAHDRSIVELLLGSDAPYIGLLGPRQRTEKLLQQLSEAGAPVDAGGRRIFGPVGLDIGAETAEEIALSVLAEIQAVQSGRRGGSLRERPDPLHDRPS